MSPARKRIECIAIGASAGGVDALISLLGNLPSRWRTAIVVVLHLPENHESRLAEVFAHRVPFDVREAADKAPVEAATLYFAPSGYHLSIEHDRHFSLSCEPPVLFSRPSIDVLLASAADAYGPALAGVLLTGANDDGAEGMERVQRAGGLTIVQSPDDALVATMPRAALARMRPDHVTALPCIRELLLNLDSPDAP